MLARHPLPALLLVGSLAAAMPAAAQTKFPQVDDQVTSWAQQLRAEAESLRSEGAGEAVATLDKMSQDEARLLEKLRGPAQVDDVLPDLAKNWGEAAEQLDRLATRMPEIVAAHRRHLLALRGMVGQAQVAGRNLERDADAMRQELEAQRDRVRAAAPGSPDAMRAQIEAAAEAATLAAREAQARLATGFAAQAGQAVNRLDDASQSLDLLTVAIGGHARVLRASADLARTRIVARDALHLLAGMADQLEGIDGVLQGLSQRWDELDGLLRKLGDLPMLSGKAGS